jgi:hypothetical protein
MKSLFELVRRSKHSIADEVDEEFGFHLDMRAREYERRGVSSEKSKAMAEARFGNVEKIRTECIQISSRKSVLIWLLNSVFMLSFVVGFFLRMLVPEVHVHQVGNVMMMIGGLGILLVYAKQAGARVLNSSAKPVRLGLNNAPPVAFDEQGRTPFDRVRADDSLQ